MNIKAGVLALMFIAGSSMSYFKYERTVQVSAKGQHYFVVDETIWKNAQPGLGDLRLYDRHTEIPYTLQVENGGQENDQKDVRILQPGTVKGKTQFVIDMAGVAEYDHIELKLSARNFVAHAKVEGQDDLHGSAWVQLADPIVYDLSREYLGANTMLRLPVTTYKYLRVTLDGPVKPGEVEGATAEFRREQEAKWRDVGRGTQTSVRDHDTVIAFTVPPNVPVERVAFDIDPSQPNFSRSVEIQNDQEDHLGSGEINKVHMIRNGNKIDSETFAVEFFANPVKTVKVIIHNGDDKPLQQTARLQQRERRIYFDTSSAAQLTLYYGDEKLGSPVYDYAKLFEMDTHADLAPLGSEQSNSAYRGRPDERPWTERHPAILWMAIIGAVLVLGAVALRSMKTATSS